MTTPEEKPNLVLNRQTAISLGMLIVLLAPAFMVNNKLSSMDYRIQSLNTKIETMNVLFERAAEDRWRRGDMKGWSRLLKAENPDLKVPDVD